MQSLATVCGLLLIVSTYGHVVKDFEGCREYFYGDLWPEWPPNRYHVEICQTYENKYYFATLYDTRYRIPVYSAYVFEQGKDHPDSDWCVEPQLVDPSFNKNMMRSDNLLNQGKKFKKKKLKIENIEETQAVYADYQTPLTKMYNRGHLNPKGHHTGLGSKATYTLTNVVPQNKKLNNDAWSVYEQTLKEETFKGCHKAFVLVGAIASTNPENWIKRENKKRVNIPDYLWHAYCCLNDKGEVLKGGAAAAKNTDDNKVQKCSVESLQQFFRKLNKNVELFKRCNAPPIPGDCSSVMQ